MNGTLQNNSCLVLRNIFLWPQTLASTGLQRQRQFRRMLQRRVCASDVVSKSFPAFWYYHLTKQILLQ
jgi:hypothetical protein